MQKWQDGMTQRRIMLDLSQYAVVTIISALDVVKTAGIEDTTELVELVRKQFYPQAEKLR